MADLQTYFPIATQTVGTAAAAITFSSIPSTYTDLVLTLTPLMTSGGNGMYIYVGNGSVDTGTNYSNTILMGNGSSANSTRASNISGISIAGWYAGISASNTLQQVSIMNYANSSTYKTILSQNSDVALNAESVVGTWRSTSSINTIKLQSNGTGNLFLTGTVATLYGIKAA